jgi:hypothetical protein
MKLYPNAENVQVHHGTMLLCELIEPHQNLTQVMAEASAAEATLEPEPTHLHPCPSLLGLFQLCNR